MLNDILAEMRRQGIIHKDMAEMIGLDETTFSACVCGKKDFTMTEVEKMCVILGLEIQVVPGKMLVDITKWNRPMRGKKRRRTKTNAEIGI